MGVIMKTRQSQRGGVMILVALAIFVLFGFAGLVIDLGRMFVIKTELQNAADACALAAARELTCDPTALAPGASCPASFLAAAEEAGKAVGARNLVDFQRANVTVLPTNVKFSTVLSGPGGDNSVYQTIAEGANPNSRYVMCELPRPGILMYFMQVLGIGNQTVRAMGVATLSPSQIACAIPLGICAQDLSSPTFGFNIGQWYDGRWSPGGGSTGSYNWIDFTPPQGGAAELRNLLSGTGACNLPPAGTPVGQPGNVGSAEQAWNTRFGLYAANYSPTGNPPNTPDLTGLAYTDAGTANATVTWPSGFNAYAGTAGGGSTTPNYLTARAATMRYQASDPINLINGNSYNPRLTDAQHAQYGGDRRLAVVPIVNCSQWASSQQIPVLDYACIFMLRPIRAIDDVDLEFRGLASKLGNPCATSGMPGGTFGPMVPTLVQ